MSIEFIGYIGGHHASEIHPRSGPTLQPDYVETVARAHEEAGFDRALVAFHSNSPDSTLIASHAASVTRKAAVPDRPPPRFRTTHPRPHASSPPWMCSTAGAPAVHIITGGDDRELRADGSHIGKDERYARTDEYLSVVRQEWTSEKPFDMTGAYYQVEGALSTVKSPQQPHIPLYFGGSSAAAIAVAGKHADVYALWGETYEQVREVVTQVRAEAAKQGRTIRFQFVVATNFAPRPRSWHGPAQKASQRSHRPGRAKWLSRDATAERRLSSAARSGRPGFTSGQAFVDRHRRLAGRPR